MIFMLNHVVYGKDICDVRVMFLVLGHAIICLSDQWMVTVFM